MRVIFAWSLLITCVFSAINVQLQLHSLDSSIPLQVTQTCTTLLPGQCCVPIDLSEVSSTTDRDHYEVTLLNFRRSTPSMTHDTKIYAWGGSRLPCDGDVAAEFRFRSVGPGKSFKPYAGMRISGVTIDGAKEMELLYPTVISYKGGLYYEYMTRSLVYAKVSHPGDGPNIIYGMDQRLGM